MAERIHINMPEPIDENRPLRTGGLSVAKNTSPATPPPTEITRTRFGRRAFLRGIGAAGLGLGTAALAEKVGLRTASAAPAAPSSNNEGANVSASDSLSDKKDNARAAQRIEDPQPGKDGIFFPETGQTVANDLFRKWEQTGGLAQNGLPLGPEVEEVSPFDGKKYVVQYFERARFERHPEFTGTPNYFLLGQLGREQFNNKYKNGTPTPQQEPNDPGNVLFEETGHRVSKVFMDYWQSHGGLSQQGFPISGEFMEKSPYDGKEYLVQYFERARFEYHPENAGTPYVVLLGQVGREQWDARGATNPENPNWRKEFGDPQRIMIYNKGGKYGVDELKIRPDHSIEALYAAIDKFFPGQKYKVVLLDTPEEVQAVIDASPIKPDYDTVIRWGNGVETKQFYQKESDGSYAHYTSFPTTPQTEQERNLFNWNLNYAIFTLPFKKDNPLNNKQPEGYNVVMVNQVSGPWNGGKGDMSFAFGLKYATDK